MRIENEDEAQETMHIVLDDPEDQVYVTHKGVTLSISLAELAPERAVQRHPIELDIMTADDLRLIHPTGPAPGDGLRVHMNGFQYDRFDLI